MLFRFLNRRQNGSLAAAVFVDADAKVDLLWVFILVEKLPLEPNIASGGANSKDSNMIGFL